MKFLQKLFGKEAATPIAPIKAPTAEAPKAQAPHAASSVEEIIASVESLNNPSKEKMDQVIQQLQTVMSPASTPSPRKNHPDNRSI